MVFFEKTSEDSRFRGIYMVEERKELRAPIFIGGTGRSGTTILIRLLSQHPDIFSIKWESQFIVAKNGLLDLVHSDKEVLKEKYKVFRNLMDSHWFERMVNEGAPNEYKAGLCANVSGKELDAFYTKLESYIDDGVDLNSTELIRGLINILFVRATQKEGASRWCEKTPSNILAIDELYRIYPNMKFINIIRDGRDVISSIVTRKFWPVASRKEFPNTLRFRGEQKPELVAEYWKTILEIGDKLASALPVKNYYELRLEDLVNRKEETIKSLFDFLGHHPTEEILNFNLSKSNPGRWKDDLSHSEIRRINEIIGPMMKKKGYSI